MILSYQTVNCEMKKIDLSNLPGKLSTYIIYFNVNVNKNLILNFIVGFFLVKKTPITITCNCIFDIYIYIYLSLILIASGVHFHRYSFECKVGARF